MTKKYLKPTPEPPAIRDAMAKASEREEKGLPVYDFSSGNIGRLLMAYNLFSDFSIEAGNIPKPMMKIANAISEGFKKAFIHSPQGLSYSPTGGTEAQKIRVIRYYIKVHGVPLEIEDTDRVIITAGGQQAMATALRSVATNSKIIAPRWEYAPVTGIASDARWKFEKLPPIEGLGFSLEDLEKSAEKGAVFYTSMPNNPSGYVSSKKLESAIEIMEVHEGAVIWDAPYLFTMFELINGKATFNSDFLREELDRFNVIAAKHYKNMCILSSISKTCLAAGLRFGFATAPKEWIQNMNAIIGRENLSSPTASFIIGDKILTAFLEENVRAHEWVSRILADRVNYLLEREIPLILPENGKFGALYVLMKTREPGSTFASRLIEEDGIVSVTAEPFYGDSVNAIRLSLVSVPYTENDQLWKENVDVLATKIV